MSVFLRITFLDDAWTTVNVNPTDTAEEVCQAIARKRNLQPRAKDDYALYVHEINANNTFERRLEKSEIPCSIQENVRKHGCMEGFKLVYKPNLQRTDDAALDDGSGSDEEMFGTSTIATDDCDKAGYLEKRGKRNTAWRERWFVLQDRKLYYHRARDGPQISFIPIHEAVIRLFPGQDTVFSIDTKLRIYFLRARNRDEAHQWIKELNRHTDVVEENERIDMIQASIDSLELDRAEQEETYVRMISSLSGILTNGIALDWFMDFLVDTNCEQNLLFWTRAEDYRLGDRGAAQALKVGKDICTTFLMIESKQELAISREVCAQARADLKAGDPHRTCFRAAQASVLAFLQASHLPAYQQSLQAQQPIFKRPVLGAKPLAGNPYRTEIDLPEPYGRNRQELRQQIASSSGRPVDPKWQPIQAVRSKPNSGGSNSSSLPRSENMDQAQQQPTRSRTRPSSIQNDAGTRAKGLIASLLAECSPTKGSYSGSPSGSSFFATPQPNVPASGGGASSSIFANCHPSQPSSVPTSIFASSSSSYSPSPSPSPHSSSSSSISRYDFVNSSAGPATVATVSSAPITTTMHMPNSNPHNLNHNHVPNSNPAVSFHTPGEEDLLPVSDEEDDFGFWEAPARHHKPENGSPTHGRKSRATSGHHHHHSGKTKHHHSKHHHHHHHSSHSRNGSDSSELQTPLGGSPSPQSVLGLGAAHGSSSKSRASGSTGAHNGPAHFGGATSSPSSFAGSGQNSPLQHRSQQQNSSSHNAQAWSNTSASASSTSSSSSSAHTRKPRSAAPSLDSPSSTTPSLLFGENISQSGPAASALETGPPGSGRTRTIPRSFQRQSGAGLFELDDHEDEVDGANIESIESESPTAGEVAVEQIDLDFSDLQALGVM
eukprot:g49832.t1